MNDATRDTCRERGGKPRLSGLACHYLASRAATRLQDELQERYRHLPRRGSGGGNSLRGAGVGLARLKKDGWIEGLGPGSRLEITVREPSTMHSLTVQQLQRWVNSATTSPAEVLRRSKVKHLLGM
jgi:hypothetical protein